MEGSGDTSGLYLGVLGKRSSIHLVDGGIPEGQPAKKVAGRQRNSLLHVLVGMQRVAPVAAGAKQHGLPEITHHRKMGFQAKGPDLSEGLGQHVVIESLPVEAAQQCLDVVTARQIAAVVGLCDCHDSVPSLTSRSGHWHRRRFPRRDFVATSPTSWW